MDNNNNKNSNSNVAPVQETVDIGNKRLYRIFNIIRPSLSVSSALELMKNIITLTDPEDKIMHQNISMRNFAFKIDRNTQGHYVVTELATTQEQIAVIRRKMEINQNFLRTMIILGDSKFNLSDEYIKKLSHSTTKRGRILFSKNFNRRVKGNIANHIKRMRYMGVLPYVNYYA